MNTTFNFLINLAGAVGFGIVGFVQWKKGIPFRKWLWAAVVAASFLFLAVAALFGLKFT